MSVNVDQVSEVGAKILQNMIGKRVAQHSFKRKEQVIPLSNNNAVKIKDDVIYIDPQLLFHGLVAAGTWNDNLNALLEYELCNYPPAPLENRPTPRPATKSSLTDALWNMMPSDIPAPSGDVQYILDSGALLHIIIWNRGMTYHDICPVYTKYFRSHYGRGVVVFDGYLEGPSTKDGTH